jgi:hypothetical protein
VSTRSLDSRRSTLTEYNGNEERVDSRSLMKNKDILIPREIIEQKIFLIRGQKVMLDSDLAMLYGVSTKRLNDQVRRNKRCFPADFMLELTDSEYAVLRSQFATLKKGRGQHRKYFPYAFTEQGVAMLSSVVNSERTISVNIEIMRAFVRLRELLSTHKDLARKLEELEKKYDEQFAVVFRAIRELMTPLDPPKKRPIACPPYWFQNGRQGFGVEEPKVKYHARNGRRTGADALAPDRGRKDKAVS